jgi:hypothetical protein
MKLLYITGLFLLCAVTYSCRKSTISPQVVSMLQFKWSLVGYNINYPTDSSANLVYTGTDSDYFQFFPDDSLHQQFGNPGAPGYFNFTTGYSLSNNSTIILKINTNEHFTILTLTDSTLILSNPVTLTIVGVNSYQGSRLLTFKR